MATVAYETTGHGNKQNQNGGRNQGERFSVNRDCTLTQLQYWQQGSYEQGTVTIFRVSDAAVVGQASTLAFINASGQFADGFTRNGNMSVALQANVDYIMAGHNPFSAVTEEFGSAQGMTHTHTTGGVTVTSKGYRTTDDGTTPSTFLQYADTTRSRETLFRATFTYNEVPNTPTSLAPSGTQGADSVTLSAVVSDPDGDNVRAQFRVNGAVVEGSTVGSGGTSTAVFNGAPNTTYTLDARTVDSAGAVSGYTAQQSFTTNRPPTPPAVTAPNGGEKVNTLATVSWTAGSDPDGQALTYDVDLTTDGGGTWSNLKTAFSGLSFTHDFTNVAASTACRVRVRSKDTLGAVSAYDESNANFTVEHNRAPTAPVLGKPENGSTQDLAAGFTFTYTATDPDTGDAASAWAFRRKIAGAAAYEYWNAGTGVFQSTIVWNTNPTGSVAFASAKWTNGNTYNWSVATKDTAGVEGPFAADFSVTASSVATTTVTAPAGAVTTTSRPLVKWTLTQPEGAPQQTYQVRVFTEAVAAAVGFNPATTAATWETVEVTSAGAREIQVSVDLASGTSYRAYVRLKASNLYTAWANSPFSITLDPPAVPLITPLDEPASPFGPRVRLDIQGRDNLMATEDASFEGGTVGTWALNGAAGVTLSNGAAGAAHGTKALVLTVGAAALADGAKLASTMNVPIVAGVTYTVSATVTVPVGSAVRLGLENDASGPVSVAGTGAAQRISRSFTALASRVNAGALLNAGTGGVAANAVISVDAVKIEPSATLSNFSRGGLVGLAKYLVERSEDSGVTWTAVRDAEALVPDAQQRAVALDYEPPRGVPVLYRASTLVDL